MNKQGMFGAVLILLGAFVLFNRVTFGTGTIFEYFWASLFVIPVGLFFHWLYFSITNRKGVGLLIPGGIIVSVGIVCQISTLFNSWNYMWPGFIMAVAVGLFEFYWFGSRNKWMLIPICILTALSLLFFTVFSIGSLFSHSIFGQPIIAIAFIVVGVLMLFGRKKLA